MENYLSLIISIIGLIITILFQGVYNQKFITRYKRYKNYKSKKIINLYKNKIVELFKKTKDPTKIEDEFKNMLEELQKDNIPLRDFENLNASVKISLIFFGISLLSQLLYLFLYGGLILEKLNLQDISYLTMFFGILCLFSIIYSIYSLNKAISEYELEG
jgi:ABC-type multidrug transport system fused ATPase/permease subunit